MSTGMGLFLTVLLLAVNAYFVAAEFAVTSSRRAQVEPLAKEGKRGAAQALYALEHVSLMLAISQLGITVMSTSLGAIAEPALAHLLEGPLQRVGAPEATAHGIAIVIALILVLFLHVVFGEMVPKNLSIAKSTHTLLILAPSLVALGRILRPLVVAMDSVANWFIRLAGFEPKSEIAATYTAREVATIVEVSREEGKLRDDLGLLAGTLEFAETASGSLMVATKDLVTLSLPVTPSQVETLVAKTGFSRFPVVDEEGALVGYVHLKDVLYAKNEEERNQPIPPWRIRPLATVGADLDAEEALRRMQRSSTHMVGVRATALSGGEPTDSSPALGPDHNNGFPLFDDSSTMSKRKRSRLGPVEESKREDRELDMRVLGSGRTSQTAHGDNGSSRFHAEGTIESTRKDEQAGVSEFLGVLFLEDLLEELIGQVKDSLQR